MVREYDKINSHNIARFFIAIRETYPIQQKLHIILDGAGYHRSEQVKEWAYLMNIDLHYLPHSPNLNPIERLWKVMNEQVRNNRYFTSAKVFRKKYTALSAKYYRDLPGYWRVVLMTTSRR
jgi:transposase